MEDALRAGIAIYNAGGYHDAHDAWEAHWLDLESGTDDERFLHGLIQFTAAIHHATECNWAGLQGLARSAREYLQRLDSPYRRVPLASVRSYLEALAADPEHVERGVPPALYYAGEALRPVDLVAANAFEPVAIVASVLAEAETAYDEAVVESAIEFAMSDPETGDADRFEALLFDFVDGEERDVVYARLEAHVERRRSRQEAVDELFDP